MSTRSLGLAGWLWLAVLILAYLPDVLVAVVPPLLRWLWQVGVFAVAWLVWAVRVAVDMALVARAFVRPRRECRRLAWALLVTCGRLDGALDRSE